MNEDFKVTLHDDGKCKWQSFEASLTHDMIHHLSGYGEDEEEALKNLWEKVDEFLRDLSSLKREELTVVNIDCRGREI